MKYICKSFRPFYKLVLSNVTIKIIQTYQRGFTHCKKKRIGKVFCWRMLSTQEKQKNVERKI